MGVFNLQPAKDRFKAALADADWKGALDAADNIWASGERNASVCLGAQRAAKALHELELAETWVDRGLKAKPDWRLMRLKGDFHVQRSEWKEARKCYEEAVHQAPDQAIPNALLGKVLLHFDEYAAAAERLRLAVEIEPRAGWFQSLGMCQLRMGDYSAAKEAFSRANEIERKPNLEAMIADLQRRLEGGSVSNASAGFYDDVYSRESNYSADWRDSVYVEVWGGIVGLLKANRCTAILDLGCGPGQFACCVVECIPSVKYHGVDFSEVAVELGRQRAPHFRFSQVTLPVDTYKAFEPFDAIVCTEVLEHIDEDVPVLKAVPSETYTIFSVPNFDSFGHVRVFKSETDVQNRYGHLFRSLEVTGYALGKNGGVIWLAAGVRA